MTKEQEELLEEILKDPFYLHLLREAMSGPLKISSEYSHDNMRKKAILFKIKEKFSVDMNDKNNGYYYVGINSIVFYKICFLPMKPLFDFNKIMKCEDITIDNKPMAIMFIDII